LRRIAETGRIRLPRGLVVVVAGMLRAKIVRSGSAKVMISFATPLASSTISVPMVFAELRSSSSTVPALPARPAVGLQDDRQRRQRGNLDASGGVRCRHRRERGSRDRPTLHRRRRVEAAVAAVCRGERAVARKQTDRHGKLSTCIHALPSCTGIVATGAPSRSSSMLPVAAPQPDSLAPQTSKPSVGRSSGTNSNRLRSRRDSA